MSWSATTGVTIRLFWIVSTRPWITNDDLWALIEPILPPWPDRSPGPRPVADRLCLQGILDVRYNDVAWQLSSLPE